MYAGSDLLVYQMGTAWKGWPRQMVLTDWTAQMGLTILRTSQMGQAAQTQPNLVVWTGWSTVVLCV